MDAKAIEKLYGSFTLGEPLVVAVSIMTPVYAEAHGPAPVDFVYGGSVDTVRNRGE